MADVVVDTDIASLLHKGRAPTWVHRHISSARVWITFVTVAELAKWAEVRRWGETRRGNLDLWVAARPMLPYDPGVARTWGSLAAGAQLRGRSRPQNDMWVAACCIHHGVPLLTGNERDFADFAEFDGLQLVTG